MFENMSDAEVLQLVGRMAGMRTKGLPSATAGAQNLYGTGGLFAWPGIKDPVISAVSLPQNTLASRLPSMASMIANEVIGFITEAAAGSGSEPAGPCDDPPTAGLFKTCTQVLTFGRYSRQTQVFDLSSSGTILNRGITANLGMLGGPSADLPFVPTPAQSGVRDLARNAYSAAIAALGIAMLRKLGPQLYTGNPTNNNVGGGYKEFKGLDLLINTGYVDAQTPATACAGLDSDVRDFASADISTDAAAGPTLVKTLTNMIRNLKKRAEDTGLAPVQHTVVMRWSAFMELTEIWPCVYGTYRCPLPTGATVQLGAEAQNTMREQMRNGQYLLVDGEQVEVIIDDFIAETRPDSVGFPSRYRSDIYIVPLRFAGNNAATYMEFFDFAGPAGLQEAARAFGVSNFYNVTDGGRFVIHNKPPNNFCVQLLGLTVPRLVLLTPHLAGRLQNVAYSPLKHEVSSITTENTYVGGGVLTR